MLRYRDALWQGFRAVSSSSLLTNRTILTIQATLEQNEAGYRRVPGTTLNNEQTGEIVYTPPQDHQQIEFIVQDLKVSRITATRYLDELCATGFLKKRKIGRNNYYLNPALTEILTNLLDPSRSFP